MLNWIDRAEHVHDDIMKFKNLKKIYQRKIVIKAVRENLKLNLKKYEIEIKKNKLFFSPLGKSSHSYSFTAD